ncbi:MAG: ketose-bisphosphate aldolase [Coprobacillaceae bacterium]
MLINMNQMLKVAKENKFAVPAFNISSDFLLKSVLSEAEATNSPVILEVHPDELDFCGEAFSRYIVQSAKEATVPVVVHLDHGANIDQIMRAIRCGYTSVMIDASHDTIEDNIAITKKVVEFCKPLAVSVEAELGTIGNNDGSFEGASKDILYTKPQDVERFINETDVDTLAIAIGTAHGLYPENFIPELRLDILEKIINVTESYLVLHGGSNNKDEEIAKAVEIGIQKINISSDYKSAFFYECKKQFDGKSPYEPHLIFGQCIEEARKVINHKLVLLNTLGQAKKYKQTI